MAGVVFLILNICIILLAGGGVMFKMQAACVSTVALTSQSSTTSPQADIDVSCCTPVAPHLQDTMVLDLNRTFFINSVVLNATFGNHDGIEVDIGTSSCGCFDDRACYVTCSSRDVVEITTCYVTINVSCDVDNVKGRYVRMRQNSTRPPKLCDLKVMGYLDPGKNLRNFALNAQCTQSSTYINWKPENAVDGNRNGNQTIHSCTHTQFNTNHWWRVDLKKLILVSHIIIANRQDCCGERLANFTVELGRLESNDNITYTLCHYFDGVAGPLTTLNCTRSIWGRFVRISKGGEPLTLCEVEVYGDTDDNNTGLPSSEAVSWQVQQESGNTCQVEVTEMTTSVTSYEDTNATDKSTVEVTRETSAHSTDTRETGESTSHPQDRIMAASSTPTKYYYCSCIFEHTEQKKTQQEVGEAIAQTAKALTMQPRALAKQVHKKSSATDRRLSSTAVGIVSTAVFSSIFAVIVLYDLHHLYQYLFSTKPRREQKKKGEGTSKS